jgi:cytochrome c553
MLTGAVLAAMLLAPASAWAGDIVVAVDAPASVVVGSTVEVQVTVTSAGLPVAGAEMSLSYRATLGGVVGFVELDRGTTDEKGFLALHYQQRAENNDEMRVEYLGPSDETVDPAVFNITVGPGSVQLYRSQAGVSIPWLKGSAVIGLITLVWSVLAYAAFQLVLIGRRAEGSAGESGALRSNEEGSAWIGVVLAVVTLITAVGMVIVFFRSPLTHGNLGDPTGASGSPWSRGRGSHLHGLGITAPRPIDGGDPVHDGAVLWIRAGCVSCHGIGAAGGEVGPDMSEVESLADFSRDTRRGPDEMPPFGEGVLSDADLASIFAWLEADTPPAHQ